MPRKSNTRAAQGSGTIRKKTVTRKGQQYTYWEGRVTVGHDPGTGKQIQKSFTGKTQKEVREKIQAAAVAVNDGTYQEPSKMTVGEWLDTWAKEYLGGVKPFTVRSYNDHIKNHIKPALGAVKLEALTTPMIQGFYNSLEKPKETSPASPLRRSAIFTVCSTRLSNRPLLLVISASTRRTPAPSLVWLRSRYNPLMKSKASRFCRPSRGTGLKPCSL